MRKSCFQNYLFSLRGQYYELGQSTVYEIKKCLSNYNLIFRKNNMPGHVKKSDGPDPDPSPWLIVSDELKVKLKAKPYDPKKSVWVPEKATGGYLEGLIDSMDGEKVSVKLIESGDVSIHYTLYILIKLENRSLNILLTISNFLK